jgi:aspartyl-tRNA(Asn)/glutamyl-tRNA(Gln) amidotransferase subunit B
MEKGSMRCEPTVNLKILKEKKEVFTPLTEIKNLNSFRFVKKALENEIERQKEAFLKTGEEKTAGNKVTVGFRETAGQVEWQRGKEEAHDYRYFPEPDIPPLTITDAWLEKIRSRLGEMPRERRERFKKEYKLSDYQVKILTEDKEKADYFESLVKAGIPKEKAANLLINQPQLLGTDPREVKENLEKELAIKITDEIKIREAVKVAIQENPEALSAYRSGKNTVFSFFMGEVQRKLQGRADPQLLITILSTHLKGVERLSP